MLTLFWHRRDLRLHDNTGLFHSLKNHVQVQPLFIFDTEILQKLKDPMDARVTFLQDQLREMKDKDCQKGSDLCVFHEKPQEFLRKLLAFTLVLKGRSK
jgi:deoxyribodipyrimidine photo-lyase